MKPNKKLFYLILFLWVILVSGLCVYGEFAIKNTQNILVRVSLRDKTKEHLQEIADMSRPVHVSFLYTDLEPDSIRLPALKSLKNKKPLFVQLKKQGFYYTVSGSSFKRTYISKRDRLENAYLAAAYRIPKEGEPYFVYYSGKSYSILNNTLYIQKDECKEIREALVADTCFAKLRVTRRGLVEFKELVAPPSSHCSIDTLKENDL